MNEGCERYIEDPEANAAHLETCEACRELFGELDAPVAAHRPISVDALPLAAWEGASHRSWPLVVAGAVLLIGIAAALFAIAGISPRVLIMQLPSRDVMASVLNGGGAFVQNAPRGWQIGIGIGFLVVNSLLFVAPLAIASSGPGMQSFGHSVTIDRPVKGDVQVYGGAATVRDVIDGDLFVFGEGVTFEGNGRVTGNVIWFGGQVTNGEGRIGGRLYSPTSFESAAAAMTRNAVILSLLVVWLIAAVILALMSGRELRLSSIEVRSSPLHCFALGLVAMTSFVLSAIVFSYLIPYLVGVPLLAALGVFAMLTKVYGTIAVFHAVGTLVAGSKTRDQLARRKWLRGDLAMVVVGLLILGAVRMLPVVGPLVWGCASVFGVGVALATKFGRREPWFLVWRPADA